MYILISVVGQTTSKNIILLIALPVYFPVKFYSYSTEYLIAVDCVGANSIKRFCASCTAITTHGPSELITLIGLPYPYEEVG